MGYRFTWQGVKGSLFREEILTLPQRHCCFLNTGGMLPAGTGQLLFPCLGRKLFPGVAVRFVPPVLGLCSNVQTLFSQWDFALSFYLKFQYPPSTSYSFRFFLYHLTYCIFYLFIVPFFPLTYKLHEGRVVFFFFNQSIPSRAWFLEHCNQPMHTLLSFICAAE